MTRTTTTLGIEAMEKCLSSDTFLTDLVVSLCSDWIQSFPLKPVLFEAVVVSQQNTFPTAFGHVVSSRKCRHKISRRPDVREKDGRHESYSTISAKLETG